jgi:predicted nucleic acid-binding protein
MLVLIDTNILLDVIQKRHPHHDPAARVWKLVEEQTLIGFVSAISFNNIFYVIRSNLAPTVRATQFELFARRSKSFRWTSRSLIAR